LAPVDGLGVLLSGFGLNIDALPTTLEGRRSLYRSMLAERRMLIMLDDIFDAEQVLPLIPGGHNLVLTTSRRWLVDLPADAHTAIGPLTPAESVQMLSGIVGADRVSNEPEATLAITEACDQMPLAVRIAGTRLAARPGRPMRQLADRLNEPGCPLDEFSMTGLVIRDRLEASVRFLDPAAEHCFHTLRLVDPNNITATSVAHLLRVPVLTADRELENLVHHGLLIADDKAGGATYHMPRLLHLYARERSTPHHPSV
jgi:hypothetical protein